MAVTQNAPQSIGGVVTGIAAAGADQANATALTGAINVVATSTATTADGVKLPAGYPAGTTLVVVNTTANALGVWPSTGGAINGLSANAEDALAANSSGQYVSLGSDDWAAVAGA